MFKISKVWGFEYEEKQLPKIKAMIKMKITGYKIAMQKEGRT
jgi:hypothetical protein